MASANKINRRDLEALVVQLPTLAQVGQLFTLFLRLIRSVSRNTSKVLRPRRIHGLRESSTATVFGSGASNTGGFGANNNTGGSMFGSGAASSGFGSNTGASTGMSILRCLDTLDTLESSVQLNSSSYLGSHSRRIYSCSRIIHFTMINEPSRLRN